MDQIAVSKSHWTKVLGLDSGTPVILAYAVTIFSSAFLLFQVQPLISKFILPWFGGSPAVWTAAMLFFQIALFGGYLYAHLTCTYLRPRGQFLVHVALLLAAAALALYTRISPSDALKPAGTESSPLFQILLVLTASVGLPYFALSSTGPLLQKWFSDAFEGASPYRLFALSNVGSLLALLSYPFFFEVYWDSSQQASMWSWGFAVFAGCCIFCAWWTFRARSEFGSDCRQSAAPARSSPESVPAGWQWTAWIVLPALASIMFLAVTNEVCQNVATVPLLWIIPLSLYLISFIVAFDHPRWYMRPVCAVGAMLLLVYLSNFHRISEMSAAIVGWIVGQASETALVLDSWIMQCAIYFLALFLVCLICHCELAHLRPSPRYLTAYFLSMSLGGACGGIFVNLCAPHLFTTFFELPLGMLASIGMAAMALGIHVKLLGKSTSWATGVALVAALPALSCVMYWQFDFDVTADRKSSPITIYQGRNFFGLVGVQHRSRDDAEWENFAFFSGHILHGRQIADPARRMNTEIAYWGPGTGCRRALEYKIKQQPNCRIGVLGLGVGTIAGFAKAGDYLRMYEINPQVIDIANRYFYFLKDCPAKQDIVLGDARLQLERELAESGGKGHQFDVLCLDAFSGDAVPTHLLTTEAFALYKRHLKPDGIMVLNITNTYLDLFPVVTKLAEAHGFQYTRTYLPKDPDRPIYRTYYALVTNDQDFLRQTPEVLVDMPAALQKLREVPLWTDRYHNLFQILQ